MCGFHQRAAADLQASRDCLVIPSETSRFHAGCAGQENRLREIPLGRDGSQKEQATGAVVERARQADPIRRRLDRIPEQL